MKLEQIKQDLKEGQQIINDAREASRDDRLVRAYYTCYAWGIDRVIDMIDVARCVKRLMQQKQK